jgi:hypothetical protein
MKPHDGRQLALMLLSLSLAACSGTAIPAAMTPQSSQESPNNTGGTLTRTREIVAPTASPSSNEAYNAAVLANYPDFYYETNDISGYVAVDASPNKLNGAFIAPIALTKHGCCGNSSVTFSELSAGSGKGNAQITTPVAGTNSDFTRPFTIGMSITPSVLSYPGYGTYWYTGTDSTENGTGNGWDFDYGNNNSTGTPGYNVNWRYGGVSSLLYQHALITGSHQWVVAVTATSVSLYLDGAAVATKALSQPFEVAGGRDYLSFGNTEANDKVLFNCACSMSSMYFIRRAVSPVEIGILEKIAKSATSSDPTAAPTDPAPPVASSAPSADPTPTPVPVATTTPVAGGALSYNASTACINHALYTNNVLPANVGEFATNGFNTSFWGGTKSRTESPTATWGPGYNPSWGRHQYDTDMGDPSQGAGFPNPFAIVNDGGTQALQIAAYPVPSPIATSLDLMANDQYTVANAQTSFAVPSEGGSLTVNVDNVNGAQIGWKVGIGYAGAATTFIGTLTSGGAQASVGTGGSNPWTISNIHVYSGTPGTVITPSQNANDYALRSYNFPDYYSGTLDANVNQEYGFFVARLRLPAPAPGLSPAFWMLETGGVKSNNGQLLRSEWDTEEQFANVYGDELNAGNILWNSGNTGSWFSYGCGLSCGANGQTASGATGVYPWSSTGNYNSGYHDYGVLISPGGPAFPTNYSGSQGGDYTASNSPYVGTTFYLDGVPIGGHMGAPDLTQGSPDKEIMLMFQIAAPGTFLDANGQAKSDVWPQYLYAQWLRAYKPAGSTC